MKRVYANMSIIQPSNTIPEGVVPYIQNALTTLKEFYTLPPAEKHTTSIRHLDKLISNALLSAASFGGATATVAEMVEYSQVGNSLQPSSAILPTVLIAGGLYFGKKALDNQIAHSAFSWVKEKLNIPIDSSHYDPILNFNSTNKEGKQ